MVFNEANANIIRVLADGEFHSGSVLARLLGISRSAVWQKIRFLRNLGIEVCAVTGKGYRLERALELLERSTIVSGINPLVMDRLSGLEIHHQIDSTNQDLLRSAKQGLSSGTVCLAEMQTDGRGRSGKKWISPFGHNVYLSLLWRFVHGSRKLSGLSLAAGVSIVRALNSHGLFDVGLKWPNDILWRRRKLGGILVEVTGQGNGPCSAVIGLGLNCYIPSQSGSLINQDWVDLDRIFAGAPPSRNALISSILNELVTTTAEFEDAGVGPYLNEWRKWDCVSGTRVTFYSGRSAVLGKVEGITDDGLLIIRAENGALSEYASGEISFNVHGV